MPDPYASVKAHFEKVPGVTVNAGRGAQGLKVGKKMFAMFYKGDLLLTFPPDRTQALIGESRGLPFDPGTGTVMESRVLVPASKKRSWVKLCEEAAAAAGGMATNASASKQPGATRTAATNGSKQRDAKNAKAPSASKQPGAKSAKAANGSKQPGVASAKAASSRVGTSSSKPKLLSGGNPQIAKADGDGPVQAYIDAMPGWKQDVGRQLDALVAHTLPRARKAVRWNSPFYGMEGRGWFLSFHCFAKYVKVTFLNGTALKPPPPVESKVPGARYLHIHDGEALDEKQWAKWLEQASKLDGERLF